MKQIVTVRNKLAVVDILLLHNELSTTPFSVAFAPFFLIPRKENETRYNPTNSDTYTIKDLYAEVGGSAKVVKALRAATWEVMSYEDRKAITGDGRNAMRRDPGAFWGSMVLRKYALDPDRSLGWTIEHSNWTQPSEWRNDGLPSDLITGTPLARIYFADTPDQLPLPRVTEDDIVEGVVVLDVNEDRRSRYDRIRTERRNLRPFAENATA